MKNSKKIYVLDTNVLIHDPYSFKKFEDNHVCIPMVVISELDGLKSRPNGVGRNARLATKLLEAELQGRDLTFSPVHQSPDYSITPHVELDNGGSLSILLLKGTREIDSLGLEKNNDNFILRITLDAAISLTDTVVLVSKDTNLRLKALSHGLKSEDYETDKVHYDELYTGYSELSVENEVVASLTAREELILDEPAYPNQLFTVHNSSRPPSSVLAIAVRKNSETTLRLIDKQNCGKVKALNRDQEFALRLLLDPEIKLVTLVGAAGTGKTLLAIAAAMHQTPSHYRKILVSRPVVSMGNELGFLPGTIEEKLHPWMQPIFDNLDIIFNSEKTKGNNPKPYMELIEQNILSIQALAYVRGRSIPNQFIIIDEAQNLSPHEVKTILTRAGKGSKIVLTGDPDQIDNPYVDASSNGLSYVVDRFKDQEISGHVKLRTGVRSKLATISANIL